MRPIDAYGGEARWHDATAVEMTFSAWGWAFRLKWRRPFRRARGRFELDAPRARITPVDGDGLTGVLSGNEVHLEDARGNIVNRRENARAHFPGGRRQLWWDDLDQTYFAGYALWNYMTLPALMLREDIDWTDISESSMEARFPPHLPTHCAVQQFHFDRETGLLRQHDYTADVIGSWARAAHVVLEHGTSDGVPFSRKRRVTPRARHGRARAGPLLIGIEVHDWHLVTK